MEEKVNRKLVGRVANYFSKLGVAVIELTDELKTDDEIVIEGPSTSIRQKAFSMQIERKPVESAKGGQSIGLKVNEKVRPKDLVYKLIPQT
jgi:putative protease